MHDMSTTRMFVYRCDAATHSEFVEFWHRLYSDKDMRLDDELYTPNILGPHTRETLLSLFKWKVGDRFFQTHLPGIQRNFIDRMKVAASLSPDATVSSWLKAFPDGGAIYRIFWMHCWNPADLPIYDQHVHRAMIFIQEGRIEELERFPDKDKLELYRNKYIAFNLSFSGDDRRKVDRALFAFGQFIKKQKLPLPT